MHRRRAHFPYINRVAHIRGEVTDEIRLTFMNSLKIRKA